MYNMQCFIRKPSEFSTCWSVPRHLRWEDPRHSAADPSTEDVWGRLLQHSSTRHQAVSTLIGSDWFRFTRTVPLTWKNNSRKSWWTSALCIAFCEIWWELLPHPRCGMPLRNWSPDTWGSPLLHVTSSGHVTCRSTPSSPTESHSVRCLFIGMPFLAHPTYTLSSLYPRLFVEYVGLIHL